MSFQLCRYIKTNGLQCQSPQLTGNPYCYFHNRLEHSHYGFRNSNMPKGINLGPTEDRESVQLAISTVINALATDQIETKRATALLYGLQLASMNATRLKTSPSYKHIVRETDPDNPNLAPEGAISTRDEEDAAEAERMREVLSKYFDDEEDEEDEEELVESDSDEDDENE